MALEIITLRCRSDNYAFLLVNTTSGEVALIDAPEAAPVNAALGGLAGRRLTTVLLTHHHGDHVEGLPGLVGRVGLTVIGCAADAHRLPPLDMTVAPGDTIQVCGTDVHVLAADGHTLNHIAYHVPAAGALFTGDSLMTHGCGRLFEGTPADMLATMSRFLTLPEDTRIYSGHDYAAANLRFATQCGPDAATLRERQSALSELSSRGESTTGVTLALEKQINPYLRTSLEEVKAAVGMAGASDLAVFAEIRSRKDRFAG